MGFIFQKGGNFNEMCLLSFVFLSLRWHQSSFPKAPWKTNGLPHESIWHWCMRGGNKEMSTWFMCPMISSTIAGRTKEKKLLALQHCSVRCFDKQAFSVQMKEMCHLPQNPPSFHYFVCPSAPAFVSPTVSEVVFEGQRASLYPSVWLSFFFVPSFFVNLLIHNLEPDLCLRSHTKSLNSWDEPSFFLHICLRGGGWRKRESYLGWSHVL